MISGASMKTEHIWKKNRHIVPYVGTVLLLFAAQTAIIWSTKLTTWPELFFSPWLVSRGMVPYRDFFDHHGFFLYYLLSPVVQNGDFGLLRYVYWGLLSLNLLFVSVIFRRARLFEFVLILAIYTSLTNAVSINHLWYETAVTTVYLMIYLLITAVREARWKPMTVGLLIAVSSFIKPNAAVILVPVLYFYRRLPVLWVFLLSWAGIVGAAIILGAHTQLWTDIVQFNAYVLKYYVGSPVSDYPLLISSALLLALGLVLTGRIPFPRNIAIPLSFTVMSLVFLRVEFGKEHLVPMAAFFCITIGEIFRAMPAYFKKRLFTAMLVLYLLLVIYGVGIFVTRAATRVPWWEEEKSARIAAYLSGSELMNRRMFIMGEQAELYAMLHKIPPNHFPVRYPLVDTFFPDFISREMYDIETHRVDLIVAPKPLLPAYRNLLPYVMKRFEVWEDTEDATYYILRK